MRISSVSSTDVAERACEVDDRVAGDPRENRHRERRRQEPPVLDDEDVLARAVGDVAVAGEHDRLVVAGPACLGRREHRVQVDPGRLRDVRDHVRAHSLPARDHRGDSRLLTVLAEIGAPGEADDDDVDGIAGRRDAELAVAVERDRPHVAGRQAVRRDELVGRLAEIRRRVRQVHVQHLGGVLETLQVILEAEDRRALLGLVAADALEDTGSVVEPVGADVNLRVGPVDEVAVHPDLVGLLHRASLPLLRRISRQIVVLDDVSGAGASQSAELGGREADEMPRRSCSRPDQRMREQRAVQEDQRPPAGAGRARLPRVRTPSPARPPGRTPRGPTRSRRSARSSRDRLGGHRVRARRPAGHRR